MENENESYFKYLDELRESGETNMFGASSYLMNEFPELDENSARTILIDWMNTFDERHPDG